MSTAITKLNDVFTSGTLVLPNQSEQDLKAVDDLSKGVSYLQRIQLYSAKTDAVANSLIAVGHFGIPKSKEDIQDLGLTIDVLVIARRAKALDMSDRTAVIASHDVNSDVFKRIQQTADDQSIKNSGCIYGPSYLIFERSTAKFYEYFCGSASARISSGAFNVFLPVSQSMIDQGLTREETPRGPLPMTIESDFVKKPTWSNHLPKVSECVTKFKNLPTQEDLIKEVERFYKPDEESEAQKVDESASTGRKT